jgi:hypothetical protein
MKIIDCRAKATATPTKAKILIIKAATELVPLLQMSINTRRSQTPYQTPILRKLRFRNGLSLLKLSTQKLLPTSVHTSPLTNSHKVILKFAFRMAPFQNIQIPHMSIIQLTTPPVAH